MSDWYVYILRCADGSLYTGITTDVHRRLQEHNSKDGSAARYTRSRQPVQLVYQESAASRSEATRREMEIKAMDRTTKESLVSGQGI
jgi:putative endonuclease